MGSTEYSAMTTRTNDWRNKALTAGCVGLALLSAGCAAAVVTHVAMSEVARQSQDAAVRAIRKGAGDAMRQAGRSGSGANDAARVAVQTPRLAGASGEVGGRQELASAAPALTNRKTSPLMPPGMIQSPTPPVAVATLPPLAQSEAPAPPPQGDLNQWANTPAAPGGPLATAAEAPPGAPAAPSAPRALGSPATPGPAPLPPAVAAPFDAPRDTRIITADPPPPRIVEAPAAPRRIVVTESGIETIPEFNEVFEVVAGQ